MLKVDIEDTEEYLYSAPWGGGRVSYNGIPFTGIAYSNFGGTNILADEYEHVDGYQEGLQIDYWQNGQKKEEWYSKNGGVYKYHKKWDEDGNLVYHTTLDDFGNLTRIVKHPNPNLEN